MEHGAYTPYVHLLRTPWSISMDTTNLQLICINTSTLCSRISRGNTNARMTMTRIASLARAGGSRVDAHLHVSSPRPVGKSQEFLSFRVGLLTTETIPSSLFRVSHLSTSVAKAAVFVASPPTVPCEPCLNPCCGFLFASHLNYTSDHANAVVLCTCLSYPAFYYSECGAPNRYPFMRHVYLDTHAPRSTML